MKRLSAITTVLSILSSALLLSSCGYDFSLSDVNNSGNIPENGGNNNGGNGENNNNEQCGDDHKCSETCKDGDCEHGTCIDGKCEPECVDTTACKEKYCPDEICKDVCENGCYCNDNNICVSGCQEKGDCIDGDRCEDGKCVLDSCNDEECCQDYWNGNECIKCEDGQEWSTDKNECVCSSEECCKKIEQHWNGNECIKCEDGQEWSTDKNECVCSSEKCCQNSGKHYIDGKCASCEPDGDWNGEKCICRADQKWNEEEGRCVPNCNGGECANECTPESCSEGQYCNFETRKCVQKCLGELTGYNGVCVKKQCNNRQYLVNGELITGSSIGVENCPKRENDNICCLKVSSLKVATSTGNGKIVWNQKGDYLNSDVGIENGESVKVSGVALTQCPDNEKDYSCVSYNLDEGKEWKVSIQESEIFGHVVNDISQGGVLLVFESFYKGYSLKEKEYSICYEECNRCYSNGGSDINDMKCTIVGDVGVGCGRYCNSFGEFKDSVSDFIDKNVNFTMYFDAKDWQPYRFGINASETQKKEFTIYGFDENTKLEIDENDNRYSQRFKSLVTTYGLDENGQFDNLKLHIWDGAIDHVDYKLNRVDIWMPLKY